ncbi:MAG: lamin tail domain-containing protein [Verrucomicrobiota bacterium]
MKDSPGSLSNFTNVYALITAANAYGQSNYESIIENVVDVENWMRVSAANHAAGNWDCFGSSGSGQNADAWISPNHRWTLFTIDLGICLDNNLATAGLFGFADNAWSQMAARPKYGRMYYRALNDLANGIMQAGIINPMLDAKYAAITAAGISATAPTTTKNWISNRRTSIISTTASANSTAFALNATTLATTTNSVTLTGTAPVEVVSIMVNGVSYTPTWTALTGWSLTVPVGSGTFNWTVAARDRNGNSIGSSYVVSVENTGVPASPVGNVVINEIMFNAATPDGEYIELFNRSTNTTFDLSGWVINGLDYTFPAGTSAGAAKISGAGEKQCRFCRHLQFARPRVWHIQRKSSV